MNDRFKKLTGAVPTFDNTPLYIASLFMSEWIISYGVPKYIFTENGTQFIKKWFQ